MLVSFFIPYTSLIFLPVVVREIGFPIQLPYLMVLVCILLGCSSLFCQLAFDIEM